MRIAERCRIAIPIVLLAGGCDTQDADNPGGAQEQTHETLVKGTIAGADKVAAALNGVSDAASAERAIAVLERETQNLQSARERISQLGEASGAEKDRFNREDSQSMVRASRAAQQATADVVGKIQAGQFPQDVARKLAQATSAYGQAMAAFAKQVGPLYE